MFTLIVLLICVVVTNVTPSEINDSEEIIEWRETEKVLNQLKETNICDVNVLQLEEAVSDLQFQVVQSVLSRDECQNSTYRCGGAGYAPGCSCWTYVTQRVNDSTVFTFDRFHPLGATPTPVQQDEDLLRTCDNAPHPTSRRFIENDDTVRQFSHCLQDGHLDCFCSTEEHNKEEIVKDNHCSNQKLASDAKCWDLRFLSWRGNDTHKMYSFKFAFGYNCEYFVKNDEERSIVNNLRKVCEHDDFVLKNFFKGSQYLQGFTHCVKDGEISCACGTNYVAQLDRTAHILGAGGCGSDQESVGNTCGRAVQT